MGTTCFTLYHVTCCSLTCRQWYSHSSQYFSLDSLAKSLQKNQSCFLISVLSLTMDGKKNVYKRGGNNLKYISQQSVADEQTADEH